MKFTRSTSPTPPTTIRFGMRLAAGVLLVASLLAAGARAQSTQPGAAVTRPSGPVTVESLLPANKVVFDISDQPVGDLAVFVARSYNFRLIDPYRLKQRVTMKLKEPLSAAEAIHLLDQTLLPLGYTVLREPKLTPPVLELRIVATSRDPGVPMHAGLDPARIPATDELRTQVMTLAYVDPQKASDLIKPVLDAKADITINPAARTLIITDTANRIRTAASLIQVLEKQAAERQAGGTPGQR